MLDQAHSITELAAKRRHIRDAYDGSNSQLDELLAVEAAIAASPHTTDVDWQIKHGIMHENGEPDFADLFIQKLAMSLC